MLNVVFAIMFVLYASMATFGYLLFGEETSVLVTSDLVSPPPGVTIHSDVFIKVFVITVISSCACSISPLISYVLGLYYCIIFILVTKPWITWCMLHELTSLDSHLRILAELPEALFLSGKANQGSYLMLVKLIILAFAFGIAFASHDSLQYVESVVGGLCTLNTSFVLPSLFYVQLVGGLSRWERALNYAIAMGGFCMALFVTVANITDLAGYDF